MKAPLRLPRGMLGMLALVAAAELFVARHALDFTPLEGWDWKLARRAADREAPRCEVLCFGDSLLKFGLHPPVLERRTGRRAYSLAVCRGPAAASYFLLRRALEAGAHPEAVVVEFQPNILGDGPLSELWSFPWGELAGPREALDLARATGDPRAFAATVLARLLPTVRGRHDLRANLLVALGARDKPARVPTPILLRNWARNRGAWASPPHHPEPEFSWDSPEKCPYFPDRFDPVNLSYIRRFLRLAAARRIPVFWLLPPNLPAYQAMLDRDGYDARHTRLVRAFQAQFPDLVVIDGRRSGYRPAVFLDSMHLDRRGAAAQSLGVAEIVAAHLAAGAAGPRWVPLPAYREPPADLPVEDLDQSQVALRSAEGLRR
jgi:hypothetical protein